MESLEIIKKFGKKIGIDIAPSDEGVYMFEVDQMLVAFHVIPELDTIVLTGDIGEPPPEKLENLYKTMLQAQYLFQNTYGATISLNPETNRFMLCKALSCKILDDDSFFGETEQFINTLDVWVKLVKNFRDAASLAEETGTPMPSFGSDGFIRA